MAGTIDMANEGISMSNSPESTVQNGGGGTIDMYGGGGLSLSHSPVSSVQVGKGAGSIDMEGEAGLLSKAPSATFGARFPSDKGE